MIPKELQEKIIDLYVNKQYGLLRIKKTLHLDCGVEKIKKFLKENNIHIRSYENKKKYYIDENYNFNSYKGAWILGIFVAIGYLPITKNAKNRVIINVKREEEEILERIKKELKYNGNIYRYNDSNGQPLSSLAFTSKIIREKIENFIILDKFVLNFIIGMIDGIIRK